MPRMVRHHYPHPTVRLPILQTGSFSGGNAAASADFAPPVSPVTIRERRRLVDSHGRTIRDLRLSITDRCNFRCIYCMEPDVRFLPADSLLTVAQLIRAAEACVNLGITRIRLTGGEPTIHPHLTDIIRGVAALPIDDLSMTTNGALVTSDLAREWKFAGLDRLTVSIDSVDQHTFAAMTRSSSSSRAVIDAITAAQTAGLGPIKANAVILRGRNDDQIIPLATLARELGIEMRFIEYMPLDSGRAWDASKLVPADDILRTISSAYALIPTGREADHSTALTFRFADIAQGSIGIIAPVTRPFCGACSRLRITADGKVRPCLFSLQEWDVGSLLRSNASNAAIENFILDAAWTKQAGHGISATDFRQPDRPMSAIGG